MRRDVFGVAEVEMYSVLQEAVIQRMEERLTQIVRDAEARRAAADYRLDFEQLTREAYGAQNQN